VIIQAFSGSAGSEGRQQINASEADTDEVVPFVDSEMPSTVNIPVHLNFAFIGFDGNGHHAFNLTSARLHSWFDHLPSVIPASSGGAAGAPAVVQYDYSFSVLELSPRVLEVVELMLELKARPAGADSPAADEDDEDGEDVEDGEDGEDGEAAGGAHDGEPVAKRQRRS
jgi:hypothetical protein